MRGLKGVLKPLRKALKSRNPIAPLLVAHDLALVFSYVALAGSILLGKIGPALGFTLVCFILHAGVRFYARMLRSCVLSSLPELMLVNPRVGRLVGATVGETPFPGSSPSSKTIAPPLESRGLSGFLRELVRAFGITLGVHPDADCSPVTLPLILGFGIVAGVALSVKPVLDPATGALIGTISFVTYFMSALWRMVFPPLVEISPMRSAKPYFLMVLLGFALIPWPVKLGANFGLKHVVAPRLAKTQALVCKTDAEDPLHALLKTSNATDDHNPYAVFTQFRIVPDPCTVVAGSTTVSCWSCRDLAKSPFRFFVSGKSEPEHNTQNPVKETPPVSSIPPASEKQHPEPFDSIITIARRAAIDRRIVPEFFVTLLRIESDLNPLAIHLSVPRGRAIGWKLRLLGVPYRWYATPRRHHYQVFPETRAQAERILRWAARHPWIDFDVGLGQINRRKLADLGVNPIQALDPEVNAALAAEILRKCLDQTRGRYLAAAECYHRGKFSGKYTSYSIKLAKNLKRISAESL